MKKLAHNYPVIEVFNPGFADEKVFGAFSSLAAILRKFQQEVDNAVNYISGVFASEATGGQSLSADAFTKVDYQTKTQDTQGEYSTANSNFTVALEGAYIVSAGVNLSADATNKIIMAAFVNGNASVRLYHGVPDVSSFYGSSILFLNTGDVVDIRVQPTTSAVTVATAPPSHTHYFKMARVRPL